jgi:Ca-activated chloride channel family protein
MTDFHNDPRLTAYALDELDAAERAEVEALLAGDEAARRAVEEIRMTASLVGAEFATSGGPALTDAQRAAITSRATKPRPILRVGRVRWVAAASVAAAAVGAWGGWWVANRPSRLGVDLAGGRSLSFADKPADEDDLESPVNDAFLTSGRTGGGGGGAGGTFYIEADKTKSGGYRGGIGGSTHGKADFSDQKANELFGAVNEPHVLVRARALPAAPAPVTVKCLTMQLEGTIAADNAKVPVLGDIPLAGYAVHLDDGRSTESYAPVEDNPFRAVRDNPLSTFGVDVDTASYANVRRMLTEGRLPPPGAVRIEEMVNYFPYDYAPPTDGRPFAVKVDVAGCPWKAEHRLVRVALKGKAVEMRARPAANLVFLVDVSGSMNCPDKLPLLLESMKLLVGELEARDRVAIVVYAGESGLALPSTSCEDKAKILAALDALHAGGSTNGAAGIQLAYDIAAQHRIEGGVNRVVLATDGDFNVGTTDESSLVKLIEEKAKSGTFLSVLGFGTGNYKDSAMEKLADRGNGNYAYVDSIKEGRKVLVEQASGTLLTIAKDVKLQIEFNPARVGSWRLVGYENRVLAAEDFKDDQKDAGDIGAGHAVTALYEIAPPGTDTLTTPVEPLKYQTHTAPSGTSLHELMTVKLRWKAPDASVSEPMEVAVVDEGVSWSAASPDFKFAAAVAAFGMCLRQSPHRGNLTIDGIAELAMEGVAFDPGGYRKQLVELVSVAKKLGAK